MKRLSSQIRIGNFIFDYVTNITIESSWNTFTDTATITLPNKFRLKNRTENKDVVAGPNNLFKRGDVVEINIGYFPNLKRRFTGFLSQIRPESILVLQCEDAMWLLKQINLKSKSFINTTIKEVVEFVTAGLNNLTIEFDDPDAKIGDLKIDNKGFVSAVTIFETLKKQFGYNIYFQDGTLQVRILNAIISLDKPAHVMDFQFNVLPDDTLVFQRDDDVGMVIRFESKQKDNTVITLFGFKEMGETVISRTPKTGGIVNSWKVPELSEDLIRKLIIKNIDKYIWEGFQGGLTTFLEPTIDHSDRIDVIDNKHPEKNGRYLIKEVVINFGIDEGFQTIELRNKVGEIS